jgi:hypothetical protein
MMHLDSESEGLVEFKDSDGYEYNYDLFILAKVLRPGYADKFYRSRVVLIN